MCMETQCCLGGGIWGCLFVVPVKREQNPEHLDFSFREMLSVISVPHRDIEQGEMKPRIETDSSARSGDRSTRGSCVQLLSTLGRGAFKGTFSS